MVVFHDDTIAGSWPALVARLDGPGGRLAQWRAAEPALADVGRADGQFDLQGYERDRADAVLGALVRLAAADGGDDQDALVLLLHLLSGMVWSLARQLADLSPDIVTVIISELTCQIRSYPWRRRTRAWAANLQADTRRAVLADLKPRHRYHPGWGEVLTADGETPASGGVVAGPGEDGDLDLGDLLQWALRAGVDPDDVALLVAIENGRDRHARRADQRVAAEQGVALRTLYRRRERALTALRVVAREYLAAVA